ncbi:ribosome biogenesis GTPase YlqF [Helicovermis profundi]|uniref:Ribosome biogenesis GTPase A n=1 Tax=Helicovermis profundi TaxID=3065157 RepID=A0AAU9ESG5_9FIRM|nr:ribosome biogenesis GTPase YlqF [Clostridia bacterium S502]
MNINWYPGHMKKTRELIQENLKMVDIVVEVLDARIPVSSKNPSIDDLLENKPKIVALNKFDLANEKTLEEWIRYYKNLGISAIPINSLTGVGINRLVHEIRFVMREKIEKFEKQGRKARAVRAMIIGIPNVGKSSLINKLVGKKSAKTGNRPGVTRGKQWIRIRKDLELFDTPGILWPKIENKKVGLNLAYTGAIKDEILPLEEVGMYLIEKIITINPEIITSRYNIEIDDKDRLEVMEAIGRRRGCLMSKNQIDYTKVAKIVLDEFRKGVLGKLSLETPDDIKKDD